MERDKIYQAIQHSPKKKEIELSLSVLFGQTDIRKIDDHRLSVFVQKVLPRIEGGEYES